MTANGIIAPNSLFSPHRPNEGVARGDTRLLFADTARLLPPMVPQTLGELVAKLEADAALENPDAVVPVRALTMTERGCIAVPNLGEYEMTSWAQRQLALRLGIRWSPWFAGIDPALRAEEVNRRLARDGGLVRVRTNMIPQEDAEADGTLRAIVSATYTPISDVAIARAILEHVPAGEATKLRRYAETDRTNTYILQLGEPFAMGGPAHLGDVVGGLLVRNSGVGYASLLVSLHLTRLVCLNGMTVPERACILRRAHQRMSDGVVRTSIAAGLQDVGPRIHQAARTLERSGHHAVTDIKRALRDVLEDARLPVRLMPTMLAAYNQEPHASAFGVIQAITLGAQHKSVTAEERIALERAAASYLARYDESA